jgi:hypothetical protein
MHVHAGTVMGGTLERSGPHVPRARSSVRRGIASAKRSNASDGGTQSSPTTRTLNEKAPSK